VRPLVLFVVLLRFPRHNSHNRSVSVSVTVLVLVLVLVLQC
jgi:hypothetical protein